MKRALRFLASAGKWCGVAACVLVVAGWIVSLFVSIVHTPDLRWNAPRGSTMTGAVPQFGINDGMFVLWNSLTVTAGSTRPVLEFGPARESGRYGFALPALFGAVDLVPLWLVLLLVATPTAMLWWRDGWRPQCDPKTRHWRRRSLLPEPVSAGLAVGVFGVVSVIAYGLGNFVTDAIWHEDLLEVLCGTFHVSDPVAMALAMTASLAIGYCFARSVLFMLRWRVVIHDRRRCLNCDYDLKGNVSGVCSECGTPVAGGAAV